MSGDVTYQALKRLSWLPNRDQAHNGTVIAGQEYTAVYFLGGQINGTVIGGLNPAAGTFTTLTATSIIGPVSGNASTATALQTPRNFSIGGTSGLTATAQSFNGTADVTLPLTGTLAVANGGTGGNTQALARTGLGLGSMAVQNASTVAITGGSINGTIIGGTTPAAGTFTTVTGTTFNFTGTTGNLGSTTNQAIFSLGGAAGSGGGAAIYYKVAGATNIGLGHEDALIGNGVTASGLLYGTWRTDAVFNMGNITTGNGFTFGQTATGTSATLTAAGVDANLDFRTVSKGTGVLVNLGSFTNGSASSANAVIDASGRIFKNSSMAKYKTNIEPISSEAAANIIDRLNPVLYRSTLPYDVTLAPDWSYYGLVAEDVAAIDPRLASWGVEFMDEYDADGNPVMGTDLVPTGVNYDKMALFAIVNFKERIKSLENQIDILKTYLPTGS